MLIQSLNLQNEMNNLRKNFVEESFNIEYIE